MNKGTKQKYLTGNLLVDGLFIGSIVTGLFLYGYLDGTGKFWPATSWSIILREMAQYGFFAIPFIAIFGAWIIREYKQQTVSYHKLIAIFIFATAGIVLNLLLALILINAVLDEGIPVEHRVLIVGKDLGRSGTSGSHTIHYNLYLASWLDGKGMDKLTLLSSDETIYRHIQSGKTTVRITTYPGKLGLPWINQWMLDFETTPRLGY